MPQLPDDLANMEEITLGDGRVLSPKALKALQYHPVPNKTDRITVILQIHHEQVNENPQTLPIQYTGLLKGSEQYYSRNSKAGEQWTQINTGWVEEPGIVVIQNKAGKALQVIPTEEERAELEAQVLEVAYGEKDMETPEPVPHGRFSLRWLENNIPIYIRSRKGIIPITVTAIIR